MEPSIWITCNREIPLFVYTKPLTQVCKDKCTEIIIVVVTFGSRVGGNHSIGHPSKMDM